MERGRILVGTASWSDPGFVADWYPKGLPAAERLPYYAAHFNYVELNSSFYAIPAARQVERWCEQTPEGFVFDVKLHKLLSRHSAGPQLLPADLRKEAEVTKGRVQLTRKIERAMARRVFREMEPLEECGKLGAYLLQLSPAFSPRSHELEELAPLIELFEGKKLAIELRNRGWVTGERYSETHEFFQEHGVTFVMVDAPETEHFMAMPAVEWVTNRELAYFRLHGRNVEGYVRGRTVAARFNYQYSEHELEAVAESVQGVAEQAVETHVVYNNNASDYAIQSAQRFQELIRAAPVAG